MGTYKVTPPASRVTLSKEQRRNLEYVLKSIGILHPMAVELINSVYGLEPDIFKELIRLAVDNEQEKEE